MDRWSSRGSKALRGIGVLVAFGGALMVGAASSWAGPVGTGSGLLDARQVIIGRDGAPRQLYGVASPEGRVEDFGRGDLVGGVATVALDPEYAATVVTEGYHVFLTPQGESNGLYATGLGAAGFTVREQQGGKSSVAFSYRVVARRKELAGNRMPRVFEGLSVDAVTRQAPPAAPPIPVPPTLAPLPKLEPPPPIVPASGATPR
ncbi:MAG: hypothetical protein U0821_25970 [Chloroflexota bacterium]